MRQYQIKYFKQGEQRIFDALEKGVEINSSDLIALLNESFTAYRNRSETSEQLVQRDRETLEIESTTTEKFPTADMLSHELGGSIQALVKFVNACTRKGVRYTP